MKGVRMRRGWLAILACLAGVGTGRAEPTPKPLSFSPLPAIESLPEQYRDRLRVVLRKPAMHIRGPVESFRCDPDIYHWLLDHPDRAVQAWLRMGAKCVPIHDQGNGRFGCKDDQGNNVHWDVVLREPRQQMWYAEGVVRPGMLLPLVQVRAIFVLHLVEGRDAKGRLAVRHQGELILHTDSKAAALVTRLLGASAPRLAEQMVGQAQTFFAGLAWYLNEHPDRMDALLAE